MSRECQKRREEIQRALRFIKCSLPYPEPEAYEGFVVQLVCNLLEEGNAAFREREWAQAQNYFREGVSVALYAQNENLDVPAALLESLYINSAATHQNIGDFEIAVKDCDHALEVCKDSGKALYRKAVCLNEMGKFREAFDCITSCLLTSPQDKIVNNLAQEISASLRSRKVSQEDAADPEDDWDVLSPLQEAPSPVLPAPVPVSECSEDPGPSGAVPVSSLGVALSVSVSEQLQDGDVMGDELDSLLDSMSKEEDMLKSEAVHSAATPADLVPLSSPRLPPAFFSTVGSQLNALNYFTKPKMNSDPSGTALDTLDSISPPQAPPTDFISLQHPLVVGDGLDSLSEFTLPGGKVRHSFLPSVELTDLQNPVNSPKPRNGQVTSTLSRLSKHPLEHTHDFTQACSTCFTPTGSGVLDFEYRSGLTHGCKKDILLCRKRGGANSHWRRVRPRPTHNNFKAAFVLCREVLENQVCQYGEDCTFAYCQEEIDVWTQERRGLFFRELLFHPIATNERQELSVTKILKTHTGMFMFLCEACFNCKPRIISKCLKENPALCANTQTQHQFDKKKCLVHAVKSGAVCYSKIRVLSSHCQFDACRHAFSLGCQRGDGCCFAHSLTELKIWILQKDSGITAEEIVQESKKHWNKEHSVTVTSCSFNQKRSKSNSPIRGAETLWKAGPVQGSGGAEVRGQRLDLMMKFACGQCWRDGLISEPDRELKYCSAKARHSWIKERRVLLVKSHERNKWVTVRPLPFAKTFPQQYDICIHVLKQRKCNYIGNCSYAHSQEEKELWTFMKNNGFRDVQQVYDVWLSKHNRQSEGTSPSQPTEEKKISMPTDFAELTLERFYCPLCGKHSNSERQWQQHISCEKHKQRVLSGEGEEENLTWSYRFPGRCFSLCCRLEEGCPDGVSCDSAHSEEELQEWHKRRDFLRRRLEKARADMLISAVENDFGDYNFLLQD